MQRKNERGWRELEAKRCKQALVVGSVALLRHRTEAMRNWCSLRGQSRRAPFPVRQSRGCCGDRQSRTAAERGKQKEGLQMVTKSAHAAPPP